MGRDVLTPLCDADTSDGGVAGCGCAEARLPVSLVQNEHVSFQYFVTKLVNHSKGSEKGKKKENLWLYIEHCY